MCIGLVFKEERLRKGFIRKQLAEKLNVSPWAVRSYEDGTRCIPHDIAHNAANVLRSPRLRHQVCFECPSNILTMPWLDRVDTHPVVVKDKLIQALQKAMDALKEVDLINKSTAAALTEVDRRALDVAIRRLAQARVALDTCLGVMETQYGCRLDEVRSWLYDDLVRSGCLSEQLVVPTVKAA